MAPTAELLPIHRSTPIQHAPSDGCRRAEALLASVECEVDATRRAEAEREAVLLTLDLAEMVARRYHGRGIDSEDLLQVARLALVKAARGYRSDKGSGFAAYAVPTISGEVKRHFRDVGWAVRPPRRLQELRADLGRAEEGLRHDLRREPTELELASRLAVTRQALAEARESATAYRAVSLDLPASEGGFVGEGIADGNDDYATLDQRIALADALEQLDERERTILRLRFVEDRTQSEIGLALGVSQMQVSRLISGILARLREDLDEFRIAA